VAADGAMCRAARGERVFASIAAAEKKIAILHSNFSIPSPPDTVVSTRPAHVLPCSERLPARQQPSVVRVFTRFGAQIQISAVPLQHLPPHSPPSSALRSSPRMTRLVGLLAAAVLVPRPSAAAPSPFLSSAPLPDQDEAANVAALSSALAAAGIVPLDDGSDNGAPSPPPPPPFWPLEWSGESMSPWHAPKHSSTPLPGTLNLFSPSHPLLPLPNPFPPPQRRSPNSTPPPTRRVSSTTPTR
jgi:hypothetical protein